MTRRFTFAAALCALALVGVACSDRGTPVIAEMDEPLYLQAVQLDKQGRKGEALTSFLKVIDRRGERGAPESHLEVASIYLNHAKDPVLAYYHFKRYLELQPNSSEAPRVRGMVEASLREVAKRFPGRPADDQSVRLAAAEENAKLRRENEELRAELQTLRGGGAVMTRSQRMVSLPDESRRAAPPPEMPANQSPIIPAPATPTPTTPRPTAATMQPMPSKAAAGIRSPTTTTRPAPAGRTHTVKQKEGLFAIARQFDPQNPGRKVQEIVEANRDVLPNGVNTPLRTGMTLRIP